MLKSVNRRHHHLQVDQLAVGALFNRQMMIRVMLTLK
jgi:hypothetical protein